MLLLFASPRLVQFLDIRHRRVATSAETLDLPDTRPGIVGNDAVVNALNQAKHDGEVPQAVDDPVATQRILLSLVSCSNSSK